MIKSIGMARAVDELGRVIIPIEIRKKFGIEPKDTLEILVDTNKEQIIFRKAVNTCLVCSSQEDLHKLKGEKYICGSCIKRLSKEVDEKRAAEIERKMANGEYINLEEAGIKVIEHIKKQKS